MGRDDTRVEYRVDGGDWMPMRRVSQPDPRLLVENMRDDLAETLRGYDRSPEAKPSPHLWRGALPTDLAAGEPRVEVRAFDAWHGEQRPGTTYLIQPLPQPPPGHRTARRPARQRFTYRSRLGPGGGPRSRFHEAVMY